MSACKILTPESHVVDILGSTKGRDQPIMLVGKALELVTCISESAFLDQNTVILDPFCKAGEILLAAALRSCVVSKGRSKPLVSSREIAEEIYGGRYYALAPDERHYLLSLRTFYGNEKSHDKEFARHIRNGNYLSEVDGKLRKNKFKEEFKAMIGFIRKTTPGCKIVAVGNPPYQEADGGAQASATPIYNFFVEQLIDCGKIEELAVVIPARWFSGGKNLGSFRKKIANSPQVKTLQYFERAEDVFPTVHIQGGVCFLHWKRSHHGETEFLHKNSTYQIALSKFDIIPDDPEAASIIEKIMNSKVQKWVSDFAWSGKPFGLRTFYFKRNPGIPSSSPKAIKCYVKGKNIKYVSRSIIAVNKDKIEKWKVAIPGAYATGARRCTLPKHQVFLVGKGEITTETYNIVNCFNTKTEAERYIRYLQTDFVRYLLGLRKLTQHIPKDRWSWVPYMGTDKEWTDEKLFDFFKLTKQEREHIKRKVQEWS